MLAVFVACPTGNEDPEAHEERECNKDINILMIKEALRLYPTVTDLSRQAIQFIKKD